MERKAFLDKVIFSIIRLKQKDLAQELFLRINENEFTFEEIASQYSQGSESKSSGLVGPIMMGKIHKKLSRLLRFSKRGKVLAPFYLEEWWVIVKLKEIINISLDENIRVKLFLELGEKRLEREMKKHNYKNQDI